MTRQNKILTTIKCELEEFPTLVRLHIDTVPGTIELEKEARELVLKKFPEAQLHKFIINVHKWGGHREQLEENLPIVLANVKRYHFELAFGELTSTTPNIETALACLMVIPGLGVSYGSKHLRFLCPALCPILDSVMKRQFKYPDNDVLDTKGYKLFQKDVIEIAKLLQENHIPNPINRPNGCWFAGDVDMAIFACLQRKAKKPGWV